MSFDNDTYDLEVARDDLRRIASLLAERTEDDNAQDWSCDLEAAADILDGLLDLPGDS